MKKLLSKIMNRKGCDEEDPTEALKRIKAKLDEECRRTECLKFDNKRLREEVDRLENQLKSNTGKIRELSAKVREQNEADLLLEATRIVQRIQVGEKVKQDDTAVNQMRYFETQLSRYMPHRPGPIEQALGLNLGLNL